MDKGLADFGGKRQGGETAWQTAARECGEECGVAPSAGILKPVEGERRSHTIFLAATQVEPTVRREIQEVSFVPWDKIDIQNCHPRLKYDYGNLLRTRLREARAQVQGRKSATATQTTVGGETVSNDNDSRASKTAVTGPTSQCFIVEFDSIGGGRTRSGEWVQGYLEHLAVDAAEELAEDTLAVTPLDLPSLADAIMGATLFDDSHNPVALHYQASPPTTEVVADIASIKLYAPSQEAVREDQRKNCTTQSKTNVSSSHSRFHACFVYW